MGQRFQITIPKTARDVFNVEVGDLLLFVVEDGKLTLTKSVLE